MDRNRFEFDEGANEIGDWMVNEFARRERVQFDRSREAVSYHSLKIKAGFAILSSFSL